MTGPQGETFVEARDGARLKGQRARVLAFMFRDSDFHTLEEISQATGDPEASVSARLRQLRHEGYVLERKYLQRGLHSYRLGMPPEDPAENAS